MALSEKMPNVRQAYYLPQEFPPMGITQIQIGLKLGLAIQISRSENIHDGTFSDLKTI